MTDIYKAAQQALEALVDAQNHNYSLKHKEADQLVKTLRAVLAEQQEPVAWMVMNGVCNYQLCGSKQQADALCAEMQKRHDLSGSVAAFHVAPLYTAPQPKAQPLTDEQIIKMWRSYSEGPSDRELVSFTREIEQAHGIHQDD